MGLFLSAQFVLPDPKRAPGREEIVKRLRERAVAIRKIPFPAWIQETHAPVRPDGTAYLPPMAAARDLMFFSLMFNPITW